MNELVIADNKDYMITYHQLPSCDIKKPIVITFGKASTKKTAEGFGTAFLLKYGYENIYVAQRKYTSYQGLSRECFRQHVTPYLIGRSVFSYGSSLGAYAALYYGSCIGANIVAMSPRISIAPGVIEKFPYVANATWVKKKESEFLHVPMAKLKNEHDFSHDQVFIAYDPLVKTDHWYFEQEINTSFPNANTLLIENGLHSVSEAMQASGVLKRFLFHIFENNKMPEVVVDIEKNPKYMDKKSMEYFSVKDYKNAAKCLKTALLVPSPRSVEVLRRLVVKGHYDVEPDKSYLTPSIKSAIYKSFLSNASEDKNDFLKEQILFHEKLFHFSAALDTAKLGRLAYANDPYYPKKVAALERAIKYVDG